MGSIIGFILFVAIVITISVLINAHKKNDAKKTKIGSMLLIVFVLLWCLELNLTKN